MVYLPLIIGLLVSGLMVPVSMRLARKFETMDKAATRKIYSAPTPRLGGIAIMAGILCGAPLSGRVACEERASVKGNPSVSQRVPQIQS